MVWFNVQLDTLYCINCDIKPSCYYNIASDSRFHIRGKKRSVEFDAGCGPVLFCFKKFIYVHCMPIVLC